MRTSYLLYSFCSILWLTTLSSCEKFLSETPRTSVSDEQLFTTSAGFEQALNGVYVRIGGRSLYGDNLSMGYLSALAKNYNVSSSSHYFFRTTTFNYENSSLINSIWNQAYRSIATLNNILSFIDERRHVFSSNRYAEIKGESLAMRAFLHFDLLRLFGANYQSQPQAISIPYRKTYTLQVKPAQPANEVIAEILADLTEAETLLADDPINSENLNNRRYRLNRYAILALKARIYQYIGDKAEASRYANMVIASNLFSFVENAAISTINPGRKDRLFTTELVFGLRVIDIQNWTDIGDLPYFRYSYGGSDNAELTLNEANFRDLFEAAINPTDFRY
ncbi:RagB/SusD family nutrient uptake outer membrane protein [Sphingobacterium oryzagri]|uniref:RagB/SusD family nutrient uptake outer membrane protein n=1 Tax=Sphingobacterium oryzagri TaxID=3025669 RepID=A0ABY7WM38_9SPHI|nr:RagB/SusD family nutrient uptake outer membrane protein [Sphingobacterium sp. KACC 22765]WDF68399.1 RagB/SusD family nutrient uptake outer membrane protein [Sphingobacterium sp. KACC 22765]